ncbi:uncharacterized protein LOC141628002 [Silene latifolia]|uniref:uncharacterized protein LOC141628002 n=1 Tax=Silene latifolia TaxID=37657 RepID=UPI003D77B06A
MVKNDGKEKYNGASNKRKSEIRLPERLTVLFTVIGVIISEDGVRAWCLSIEIGILMVVLVARIKGVAVVATVVLVEENDGFRYDAQFIHTRVTVRVSQQQFYLTMALVGDFNTVINLDERLGGNIKQNDMDEFIDCLATCGMTDIPATGAFYTWNNKQDPQSRIYSRLDRFLVNQEWQTTFPDMMAHFHPAGLFDHSRCTVGDTKLVMTRRASFKYFNMWGKAPDFITRVKEEWDKTYPGHKMFNVVKKLKALKPRLKELNKECYSNIENSTSIAESELAAVQLRIDPDPQNAELIQKEVDITTRLKQQQPARISFLKQKAKTQWLEDGDSNTAYFHGAISKRCNLNKVIQIENQRRALCCDSKSIQEAFLDYYESLLGSRKATEKVTAKNITLIPKCERPTSVKHFRPIACCNMIYKVILKLLCNRLSLVLPDIISENQGAFIKGRSIIENVLICQDIVQMYKRKAISPRCLFKIDLQKAYDTVEWKFLEQLLHGLGFPEVFSQRVMTCVTSTRFSLCLNGSQFGHFKGQRGLRHGDPISPLLFTLCMDYLTRMIGYATDHWPFQYNPSCKGIKLNHLMFVDDLLMFCKGNAQSIMLLTRAFSSFSKASGLTMNNTKSEVYYNGVSLELKNDIHQAT